MIEALEYPFMQRALISGILISFLASYYGVFIVQRKMSFLGSGLAHAAFGGVALGLLIGVQPLITAVPFTVLSAIGITYLSEKTEVSSDTAVGIFFAVSMALGVLFLSLRDEYASDAFGYLFGSILTVSATDIFVTLGVVFATLLTLPIWGRWSYATFDRELAKADRLPVLRDDYILACMTAITVVVAVKVMGVVLVTAYLVVPAATARLLASTFFSMAKWAIIIGLISTIAGLSVSYSLDIPSGAAIVLTQSSIFFVVAIIKNLSGHKG